MLSRIANGLRNPMLTTRYIGRKALDRLFNAFPAFEEFTRLQMMDRRLPKMLNTARKAGLPSNVVFDIGARHGYWSEYLRCGPRWSTPFESSSASLLSPKCATKGEPRVRRNS